MYLFALFLYDVAKFNKSEHGIAFLFFYNTFHIFNSTLMSPLHISSQNDCISLKKAKPYHSCFISKPKIVIAFFVIA